MITHFTSLINSLQARAFNSFYEDGKEAVLIYTPLYHIMGCSVCLMALLHGFTSVIMTTPDFDDILNNVETYKVSVFWGAPTIYEALKDYDKTDRVNWKRLKMIISSADTLLESTATDWERRTGVALYQAYGLTESGPETHAVPMGRLKKSSFGIPISSTDAGIAHTEKNEFLPIGEIGEVVVSGPQIMKGYWKNPEETKRALVEINGKTWLRTGDLGRMDEEGYFYFYDRKKDMIVYKGYNVYAREVEEAISSHPKVRDVGVVGIPNPKVGQQIKAYVVLEKEARGKLSEEEIIKYCEDKIAHYKVPRIVEFRGEIPMTDVGKVSRRELREEEV
jgi:long-chain acyl-CoA synthetase